MQICWDGACCKRKVRLMQQIRKKNEILHDKDCPYLALAGDKERLLTELIEWGKQHRRCKRCQRIILIHNSIVDVDGKCLENIL